MAVNNLTILVFPAYAGVILGDTFSADFDKGLSRIRGGDPKARKLADELLQSFPHTRG